MLGNTLALWPACIGFILLLTPTGSLPSPRWRWWAGIAALAPLAWQAATLGFATVGFPPYYSLRNPYFVPALAAPASAVIPPAIMITLLSVVVGGASLVVQRPPARRGRPGHPERRAAGGGRADRATDPGVALVVV